MATALCSTSTLPAGVPEWVHLLPAGPVLTKDGRGPYRVEDAASLIARSMAGGKLPIDENHATDLAAPHGRPAPARGWIVALQQRADGIWGRVEWTGPGRRLLEHREYAGLSPVIVHNREGVVGAIMRASLTNTPNLTGLTSLHSAEGRRAQVAQLGADIRQLGARVALQAAAVGASTATFTSRDTMRRARDLQAECARAGLPIDLDSAIASIGDEDASLHAEAATARDRLIEQLRLDPLKATDDVIAAAAIRATSSEGTAVAAALDDLTPADREMIRRLGLKPEDYRRQKLPPAADARRSRHHRAARRRSERIPQQQGATAVTPSLETVGRSKVQADRSGVIWAPANLRPTAGVPINSILGGGSANLILNAAGDAVVASAPIAAGVTQSIVIRQVWADGVAVEYPVSLTAVTGYSYTPPKFDGQLP